MATISIQAQLTTEQLVDALDKLDLVELEKVARHLSRLRTRKQNDATGHQAELLKTARRPLPRPLLQQYRELIAKRRAQTLTEAEYQELLRMGEEVEVLHARRMEAVAELAKQRHTDLETLMHDLGVRPVRL